MQYKFSANTGFLWCDRPFLDRIRLAAKNGFDAVEFHDEGQKEDLSVLKEVLAETRLPVIGLNVRLGASSGCAAIPDQSAMATEDVINAIRVADAVNASAIHVLAGVTNSAGALDAYNEVIRFALGNTARTILIEPISHEQVPGYYLRSVEQAADIINTHSNPRLKILFDCYHVQKEGGRLLHRFKQYVDAIGHVQIANLNDRSEPNFEVATLLAQFRHAGYRGVFGCEYRPRGSTEVGLAWMKKIRAPSKTNSP